MKTRIFLLVAGIFCTITTSLFAQGTAFTYQGRLNDGVSPANGAYDLRFVVYDALTAGTQQGSLRTNSATAVSNGIFTVTLDFGNQFPGANRWLEIAVRTNGNGSFFTLSPRQPLTPAPYAITAGNVVSGGLTPGTYGNAVTFSNANNNFSGVFNGNGTGLTNVNAATLNGLNAASFWQLGGNTISGGQFIGSVNNVAFDLYAGGVRALRLILRTDSGGLYTNAPNVIGGSSVNQVNTGVVGGTVGGGGGQTTNGYTLANLLMADFGTISGGWQNTANGFAATVGGGFKNIASDYSASVGGGDYNSASAEGATVAGGENNQASGIGATVGGGEVNTASGYAATVCGGQNNTAGGEDSFAAGTQAKATQAGTFVWADDNPFNYSSGFANGFFVRCTGGVRFVTFIDGSGNPIAGVKLNSGDTAWSSISDRNAKKNFQPVDGEAVLEKLAAIPVEKWNYKWEADTNTPHVGHMAQDFKAAFYPGRDDKSISTLEFDGVELAAIQGLNEKVEVRSQKSEARIQKLEAENAELEQRLKALEKIIRNQKSN